MHSQCMWRTAGERAYVAGDLLLSDEAGKRLVNVKATHWITHPKCKLTGG